MVFVIVVVGCDRRSLSSTQTIRQQPLHWRPQCSASTPLLTFHLSTAEEQPNHLPMRRFGAPYSNLTSESLTGLCIHYDNKPCMCKHTCTFGYTVDSFQSWQSCDILGAAPSWSHEGPLWISTMRRLPVNYE